MNFDPTQLPSSFFNIDIDSFLEDVESSSSLIDIFNRAVEAEELENSLLKYFEGFADSEQGVNLFAQDLIHIMGSLQLPEYPLFYEVVQKIVTDRPQILAHPGCHSSLLIFLLLGGAHPDPQWDYLNELDPDKMAEYDQILLNPYLRHPKFSLIKQKLDQFSNDLKIQRVTDFLAYPRFLSKVVKYTIFLKKGYSPVVLNAIEGDYSYFIDVHKAQLMSAFKYYFHPYKKEIELENPFFMAFLKLSFQKGLYGAKEMFDLIEKLWDTCQSQLIQAGLSSVFLSEVKNRSNPFVMDARLLNLRSLDVFQIPEKNISIKHFLDKPTSDVILYSPFKDRFQFTKVDRHCSSEEIHLVSDYLWEIGLYLDRTSLDQRTLISKAIDPIIQAFLKLPHLVGSIKLFDLIQLFQLEIKFTLNLDEEQIQQQLHDLKNILSSSIIAPKDQEFITSILKRPFIYKIKFYEKMSHFFNGLPLVDNELNLTHWFKFQDFFNDFLKFSPVGFDLRHPRMITQSFPSAFKACCWVYDLCHRNFLAANEEMVIRELGGYEFAFDPFLKKLEPKIPKTFSKIHSTITLCLSFADSIEQLLQIFEKGKVSTNLSSSKFSSHQIFKNFHYLEHLFNQHSASQILDMIGEGHVDSQRLKRFKNLFAVIADSITYTDFNCSSALFQRKFLYYLFLTNQSFDGHHFPKLFFQGLKAGIFNENDPISSFFKSQFPHQIDRWISKSWQSYSLDNSVNPHCIVSNIIPNLFNPEEIALVFNGTSLQIVSLSQSQKNCGPESLNFYQSLIAEVLKSITHRSFPQPDLYVSNFINLLIQYFQVEKDIHRKQVCLDSFKNAIKENFICASSFILQLETQVAPWMSDIPDISEPVLRTLDPVEQQQMEEDLAFIKELLGTDLATPVNAQSMEQIFKKKLEYRIELYASLHKFLCGCQEDSQALSLTQWMRLSSLFEDFLVNGPYAEKVRHQNYQNKIIPLQLYGRYWLFLFCQGVYEGADLLDTFYTAAKDYVFEIDLEFFARVKKTLANLAPDFLELLKILALCEKFVIFINKNFEILIKGTDQFTKETFALDLELDTGVDLSAKLDFIEDFSFFVSLLERHPFFKSLKAYLGTNDFVQHPDYGIFNRVLYVLVSRLNWEQFINFPKSFQRKLIYYTYLHNYQFVGKRFKDLYLWTLNRGVFESDDPLSIFFKEQFPQKIDAYFLKGPQSDLLLFGAREYSSDPLKNSFINSTLTEQGIELLFREKEVALIFEGSPCKIVRLNQSKNHCGPESLEFYRELTQKIVDSLRVKRPMPIIIDSPQNLIGLCQQYYSLELDEKRKKKFYEDLLKGIRRNCTIIIKDELFDSFLVRLEKNLHPLPQLNSLIKSNNQVQHVNIPLIQPASNSTHLIGIPNTSILQNQLSIAPLKNFLSSAKIIDILKVFSEDLEKELFQKIPSAVRMTNMLIKNGLKWNFTMEASFLTPFLSFLNKMKGERNAALSILQEVVAFFNFKTTENISPEILANYLKGQQVSAPEVLHALINYCQATLENDNQLPQCSEDVALQVAYTMLVTKWKEFRAKVHYWCNFKTGFPDNVNPSKPVFILAKDHTKARVFIFDGIFNKKQSLQCLSPTKEGLTTLLKILQQSSLPQAQETYLLSTQDLDKMKQAFKDSSGKFLILERIKPSFSLLEEDIDLTESNLILPEVIRTEENNTNTQIRNKLKRKIEQISEEPVLDVLDLNLGSHAHEASVSASNTRRGNVQAIGYHPKNNYTEVEIAPKPAKKRRLNSSEKESQVTVPSLSSGSAYLQNVENIDPLKLWEHLSDSSLTDVITNVKSAEATYQLLVERKKQSFPITAKLDQLQTLPNFFILNPRLLGYQRTAVEKLWTGLTQGVSKILALEMGLGKTFVILELLMQSIAKGTEGAHLIFVPKSTLYQMQQEAICFQAEIKYQSLKKLLNLPEGQAFIIEHQEELVLNIKGQFPTSKILKEALTHQGKRGCIQEKMKGALRLLALLKKSPFKLALTMDLCDQERSWIKDLLAEYWENFLNSLTTHSSLKEFLKALDQPIKGISILNAETGLIDLNQVFKLNDQDFCIVAGILFNLHSDLDQSPGEISLEALQRLLMAPSIGEKSKNGIYICKDSEIDKLERFPLAFVAVDEAHRFNHSENKTSQKLENFIRNAKYKVLVTGTPLGNDYKELMALIQMANEGAFNREAIEALHQLFDRYVRTIANPDSTFEEQAHFLIQSLSHFYELNKILEKMVIFLNKENPEVSENWQNRIPTLQHIYQTIQVKDPKRYQEVTDLFIQNKLKQPGFEKRIKKALIHPKVQNLKGDQLYQEALPYFKNEPIEKWIQNSDMFRNFYKDSQTGQFNNAYLQECVEKKSKGIVFVDLILAAEVCKIVLEDSQAVEVLVFTGEMDEKKRSEVISQFKANPSTDKAQILIMMIQAGGVGLNLACAEYVFLACETYSLIEKLQAIKRVDRVGNVGLKYILHLAYNIFLSQHIQVINQKKNEWIHFILQNEELTPRFHRWLKIGELTAKQAVLNKTKNQKDAESAFNVIEAKIALLKTYYTKQILHEEFHKQQITYNDQLDDQEVDLEIDQFMREVLNEESENSLSEIDWIDEIDQCLMQIDQEANLD